MTEPYRQRILLVTRNLPPLVGGMERLNWHMAEELSKVADVRIVGPAGSAALAPAGVPVYEAPLTPLWRFLLHAWLLARHEAKAWHPDVVLAGSGLTAPIALSAAHQCKAKAVVYVHGLDVAVRNAVYRTVWLRAICHMDRVIANSRATTKLCLDAGVRAERIGIVHPGVDLPKEVPPSDRDMRARALREKYDLGEGPLLLSVGRLSSRKGLREFVTLTLPRIVSARPDVMLLIVGDAPKQALHAQAQTPESIQRAADTAGVGSHIRFLGVITDYAELGDIYRSADVHVFPVREIPGDPEGFGMVAVEAAAHGLPTVAFATGGVVDAVDEGHSGCLAPPGDYLALADTVVRTVGKSNEVNEVCVGFARRFAWPAFGEQVATCLLSPSVHATVGS